MTGGPKTSKWPARGGGRPPCPPVSFATAYDVLFVRSTNSMRLCSFVLQAEHLFCTFDLHLNVIMISMIDISTIALRTDISGTRVAWKDLVYWKGTLLSQISGSISAAAPWEGRFMTHPTLNTSSAGSSCCSRDDRFGKHFRKLYYL